MAQRNVQFSEMQKERLSFQNAVNEIIKVSQVVFLKYEDMWAKNEICSLEEEERLPALGNFLSSSSLCFILI